MGKITIQHYLNTNLKPYSINGKDYYRVYVLVRADTQNTKIKSDATNNEYTKEEFEELVSDKESELSRSILTESKIIECIVDKLKKDKKIFSSTIFSEYSNRMKQTIGEIIKSNYDNYRNSLDRITMKQTPDDKTLSYLGCVLSNDDYCEFVNEKIYYFKNLLAINYNIMDFYICQWEVCNIKAQFEKMLLAYIKEINNQRGEWEKFDEERIKEYIIRLNTYIKSKL